MFEGDSISLNIEENEINILLEASNSGTANNAFGYLKNDEAIITLREYLEHVGHLLEIRFINEQKVLIKISLVQ